MERFAVIGLGRFGARLARLLAEAGAQVLAIDSRREPIEQIRDDVDRAVCLDSTDEDALRAQDIQHVDVAIVGIGADFEATVLTTALLKELDVPRVISRATTEVRASILSRVGADNIVNPEREAADRWSGRLLTPAIMEQIALAQGHSLAQVKAPGSMYNRTLQEIGMRTRHNVNVIAIHRKPEDQEEKGKESVISAPMADTQIKPGDVLWIIGADEDIARFPAD